MLKYYRILQCTSMTYLSPHMACKTELTNGCRYYLSGTDAFRLKLLLPLPPERLAAEQLSAMQLQAGSQPAAPGAAPAALLDVAAEASKSG